MIYDEALEEIKNAWNGNPLIYPKKTVEALERAKKEHELLGLYKNQSFHFMQGNMMVAHRLQEKINKLEKELEEMK